MDQELLGFPLWLRINHFINLLYLLMRSGVQILRTIRNSTGMMTPRLGANGSNSARKRCRRTALDPNGRGRTHQLHRGPPRWAP